MRSAPAVSVLAAQPAGSREETFSVLSGRLRPTGDGESAELLTTQPAADDHQQDL